MFTIQNSFLLVIDVEGKLAFLMHEREKLFRNITKLIEACRILDIPIIFTEQVPEKIGQTVPEILDLLKNESPVVKASFSCCGSISFLNKLKRFKRKQIIVTGIETHVCVYQTVYDLLAQKFEIQVVADAVSSRGLENKQTALERMNNSGARLTSAEMIICELLKTSKHPKFKEIIGLIKN